MVWRLPDPNGIELVEQKLPCWIEFVFGLYAGTAVPGPNVLARALATVEKFSKRACAGGLHQPLQLSGGLFDRAGLVVALFGLTVGEKAASLVQVKQRPTDMVGGLGFVESLRATLVGIEGFERFSCRFVRWHQTVPNE